MKSPCGSPIVSKLTMYHAVRRTDGQKICNQILDSKSSFINNLDHIKHLSTSN